LMEFRNRDRALEHIKYLEDEYKTAGKSDDDLDLTAAPCDLALNMDQNASRHLAEIIGCDDASLQFGAKPGTGPDKLDAYITLASVLRKRVVERKAADAVLDKMVEVNNTAPAYVQRGYFRHLIGDDEKAEE